MMFFLRISFVCLFFFALASCCKEGTGGKADVVCTIRHHTQPVNGATLYVKFNTQDLPGTSPSDFDLSIPASQTSHVIRCEGLKCGDYYLYVIGYDSTIKKTVSGGVPLKIKYGERKDEIQMDVPVTEKH